MAATFRRVTSKVLQVEQVTAAVLIIGSHERVTVMENCSEFVG
jgi:hypothetical protein